jgi:hypothetical protein
MSCRPAYFNDEYPNLIDGVFIEASLQPAGGRGQRSSVAQPNNLEWPDADFEL